MSQQKTNLPSIENLKFIICKLTWKGRVERVGTIDRKQIHEHPTRAIASIRSIEEIREQMKSGTTYFTATVEKDGHRMSWEIGDEVVPYDDDFITTTGDETDENGILNLPYCDRMDS